MSWLWWNFIWRGPGWLKEQVIKILVAIQIPSENAIIYIWPFSVATCRTDLLRMTSETSPYKLMERFFFAIDQKRNLIDIEHCYCRLRSWSPSWAIPASSRSPTISSTDRRTWRTANSPRSCPTHSTTSSVRILSASRRSGTTEVSVTTGGMY